MASNPLCFCAPAALPSVLRDFRHEAHGPPAGVTHHWALIPGPEHMYPGGRRCFRRCRRDIGPRLAWAASPRVWPACQGAVSCWLALAWGPTATAQPPGGRGLPSPVTGSPECAPCWSAQPPAGSPLRAPGLPVNDSLYSLASVLYIKPFRPFQSFCLRAGP